MYVGILLAGLILFAIPPFIFYANRKPDWQQISSEEIEKTTAPLKFLDNADIAAST